MTRTDFRLRKIVDGSYGYGPFHIFRGRRYGLPCWSLHRGNGVSETFRTLRAAMIAARIVGHVADETDLSAFVAPMEETHS